jgi:hypothetical protein
VNVRKHLRRLLQEKLISIGEAPAYYPGKRPHIATVHRHYLRGVRGVKLGTVLVGGRRYTSQEEIERFIAATTAADARPEPSGADHAPQPDRDRIDRQLDEAGF